MFPFFILLNIELGSDRTIHPITCILVLMTVFYCLCPCFLFAKITSTSYVIMLDFLFSLLC
jgi:hypothetical protein